MRKPLVAVLAALALVPAAACEPTARPDPRDSGSRLVVQFGDSLSVASGDELLDLYVADAGWRVSLNHFGGTEFDTPTWRNRYRMVPRGATVILALGTRDLGSDTLTKARADARAAIEAVSAVGAARVVVPTVNESSAELHGGPDRLDKTRQWNAWLLRAEASTHAAYRALDVVDWAAASAGHIEWLSSDGVHHTPIGEMAYAGFLYGARAA